MYIYIKLLNGFSKKLIYRIPDNWSDQQELEGSFVSVPLRAKIEIGQVLQVFEQLPQEVINAGYAIKSIIRLEPFPKDSFYLVFIKKLASYYCLDQTYFLHKVHMFLKKNGNKTAGTKDFISVIIQEEKTGITNLTEEQALIVETIGPKIGQSIYYPALIHGVTGSGKTEVYKNLILEAFFKKKSSILLLPEVSLAINFQNLLKIAFGDKIKVFGFHSATGQTEKNNLWQNLLRQESIIIVGVHMPLLLPIANLGLIIIDEEHENNFQEKNHPKINTKEAALLRAHVSNIPIILGSATPAFSSFYNISNNKWNLFTLNKRFDGTFPKTRLIKLTDNKNRKNFWISSELEQAIRKHINLGQQVIIFLNRRGYSFFVQCKSCGFIPICLNCSVSLTVHLDKLMCHYCNFTTKMPEACGSCKSDKLIKKGIGTQQIISILNKIIPEARIAQADLDSTIDKKKWKATLDSFRDGNIDILVGTQMITKGYHFPKVTLVGVLWADINLGIPFYNASESTLAQIIQVAGRAGRIRTDKIESEVIIQTLSGNQIFNYLSEKLYKDFYDYEILNRKKVGYPPVLKLAEIELKNKDKQLLDTEANLLASVLYNPNTNSGTVIVLGPATPPVEMVKNIFSQKIYLKAETFQQIINLYKTIVHENFKSKIYFTPNPLS